MMPRHRTLLHVLACLAASATPVCSQFDSALLGTVTDRSSAPVSNASVRVRELTTGIARETVSTLEGVYRFLSLGLGSYEITVEKAGFQKALKGPIALGFGDTVKADFSLQVGALEQAVTVTAEGPRVETEIGDVSGRLGGDDLQELPLNGRNIFNVLALQPGVMGRGVSSVYGAIDSGNDSFAGESEPGLSAAGMRSEANSYTVDGATTNAFSRPHGNPADVPLVFDTESFYYCGHNGKIDPVSTEILNGATGDL